MRVGDAWPLLRLSLREPARAMAALRGLELSMAERWMALVLAAAASTLLAWGAEALFPVELAGPMSLLSRAPLLLAALQFAAAVLGAGLIAAVGRLFGGHGSFADALLVVAWVELVIVGLQVMQLGLTLIFPASAAALTVVAFGLYVYLLVRLTTAMHGFANPFLVALAMVGTLLLAGAVLGALLGALGLAPLPETAP